MWIFFLPCYTLVMGMDTKTALITAPQSLTAPSLTLIKMAWGMNVMMMTMTMEFLTTSLQGLIIAGWFLIQDRKMRTVRPSSFFSVLTTDFVFEFIITDLGLHSPELF